MTLYQPEHPITRGERQQESSSSSFPVPAQSRPEQEGANISDMDIDDEHDTDNTDSDIDEGEVGEFDRTLVVQQNSDDRPEGESAYCLYRKFSISKCFAESDFRYP